MQITTLLEYSDRSQLRAWLKENHSKEKECCVVMSRNKSPHVSPLVAKIVIGQNRIGADVWILKIVAS